jgi:hypothetical protein
VSIAMAAAALGFWVWESRWGFGFGSMGFDLIWRGLWPGVVRTLGYIGWEEGGAAACRASIATLV